MSDSLIAVNKLVICDTIILNDYVNLCTTSCMAGLSAALGLQQSSMSGQRISLFGGAGTGQAGLMSCRTLCITMKSFLPWKGCKPVQIYQSLRNVLLSEAKKYILRRLILQMSILHLPHLSLFEHHWPITLEHNNALSQIVSSYQ